MILTSIKDIIESDICPFCERWLKWPEYCCSNCTFIIYDRHIEVDKYYIYWFGADYYAEDDINTITITSLKYEYIRTFRDSSLQDYIDFIKKNKIKLFEIYQ